MSETKTAGVRADSGAPSGTGGRNVVQLYEVARTAHLERIADTDGVTLLYREKRYDFDERVADGVRVERAGLIGAAWYAATHAVDLVEVNEPLVTRAALRSLLFIGAARVRAFLTRRPRPTVVTYAIANVPTSTLRANLPWKARVKFELQRPLARRVARSLDRIAFGTPDARDLYRDEFGSTRRGAARLVEALPVAVDLGASADVARPPSILFLGDLAARKGFPDVMAAWSQVRDTIVQARLVIVGRGDGVEQARLLSEADPRVELFVAPPRDVILDQLACAKVLVLPSRRRPLWKEQIGLPLVEGLAYGCVVVTTDETGIAPWLRAHEHAVVPEAQITERLAGAMIDALRLSVTPGDVQRALPDRDGRTAAREWLYGIEG